MSDKLEVSVSILDKTKAGFSKVASGFKSTFKKLTDAASKASSAIKAKLAGIGGRGGIFGGLASMASAAFNPVLAIATTVASGIGAAFSLAGRAISGVFNVAVDTIKWSFKQLTRLAAVAGAGIAYSLKKSADFEMIEVQFTNLIKAMGRTKAQAKKEAKGIIDELNKISLATPYSPEELVGAQQSLLGSMGNEGMDTKTITMLGDAASAVSADIERLAGWYGRLYQQAKAQVPFSEAINAMQDMKVVTGDSFLALKKMSTEGAKFEDVMAVLNKQLKIYEGAMVEAAETALGAGSTLRGNVSEAFKRFGDQILPKLKSAMASANEQFSKMFTSGSFEAWGRALSDNIDIAISKVKSLYKEFMSGDSAAAEYANKIKDILELKSIDKSTKISIIANVLKDASKDFGSYILDSINEHKEAIGDAIGNAIKSGIKAGFTGLGNSVKNFFTETIPRKVKATNKYGWDKSLGEDIVDFYGVGNKDYRKKQNEYQSAWEQLFKSKQFKNMDLQKELFFGYDPALSESDNAGIISNDPQQRYTNMAILASQRASKRARHIPTTDVYARNKIMNEEMLKAVNREFGPSSPQSVGAGQQSRDNMTYLANKMSQSATRDYNQTRLDVAQQEAKWGRGDPALITYLQQLVNEAKITNQSLNAK